MTAPLDVLVGEWTVQVDMPGAPPARAVHAWDLDGAVLTTRTEAPVAEVPNSRTIIARSGDGWLQHYFDSRGVVRLYRMTLDDGVWTLLRTEPDFSPLDFAQRFVGTVSPDGTTIDARWETSEDGGETWELDFPLVYTRVGS